MRVLITGVCGFAGSQIATWLHINHPEVKIIGLDNFSRAGSELNRKPLKQLGIQIFHADIRNTSDLDLLPHADWVIDAAAKPSVLAGIDSSTSPKQLFEYNLIGTLNLLEYCRHHKTGFVMLSTSRVYSLNALTALPFTVNQDHYELNNTQQLPEGVTCAGIGLAFSTSPPISLYGSSKLASENIALEYADAFNLPIWINRCGVIAGAGQLGTAEQGIFSYWIHAYARRKKLRYTGFEGKGYQVRDMIHPTDVAELIWKQMNSTNKGRRIFNAGGGSKISMSLNQLSQWCSNIFGKREIESDPTPRPYDIPWFITDSSEAQSAFQWSPRKSLTNILEEIAAHTEQNPDWLETTN